MTRIFCSPEPFMHDAPRPPGLSQFRQMADLLWLPRLTMQEWFPRTPIWTVLLKFVSVIAFSNCYALNRWSLYKYVFPFWTLTVHGNTAMTAFNRRTCKTFYLRCRLRATHLWRPHGGGGAQVDAYGRGRASPMWTSTQKWKLESTDFILSSHAKKLVSFFYQNFVLDKIKSIHFSAI